MLNRRSGYLFIFIIVIIGPSVIPVVAADIEVYVDGNKEFKHLVRYDEYNCYHVNVSDKAELKWSVEVLGSGAIEVFLVPGTCSGRSVMNADRLSAQSTTQDRKKISNSHRVDSDLGRKYTLVITTESKHNVTYIMDIEIREHNIIDDVITIAILMYCLVILLLPLIPIIAYIVIMGKIKRKKQEESSLRAWKEPEEDKFRCPHCRRALYHDVYKKEWECLYCEEK